jgi:hypothetical protein
MRWSAVGLSGAVTALVMMFGAVAAQAQSKTPQFIEFPTSSPALWQRRPPDLRAPNAFTYRTRITKASQQDANFAGHYVLETWGCGTNCVMGVIINLATGRVTFLPTVCCWGEIDLAFRPVEFRRNSRLVVLSGMLNEEGRNAAHFFDFRDERLIPVTSILRVTKDATPQRLRANSNFASR